jgi:uncharacterized OB-fold protein
MITSPIFLWRIQEHLYRLSADRCLACTKLWHPYGHLCSCGGTTFEKKNLQGTGSVVSFTFVTNPPTPYAGQAPYCIALVILDEGITVMGQLTDIDEGAVCIGMRVSAVFRRYFACGHDGIIVYGFKFVLV